MTEFLLIMMVILALVVEINIAYFAITKKPDACGRRTSDQKKKLYKISVALIGKDVNEGDESC